jgi:hypothetical protein
MEAYQKGIEPGTPVSREVTVHIQTEEELKHNIERSNRILGEANEFLARTSTHKIPTAQTAEGCIKLLEMYGRSTKDIAEISGFPIATIKNIRQGKIPGKKHLEKLQELVKLAESPPVTEQPQITIEPAAAAAAAAPSPQPAMTKESLETMLDAKLPDGSPDKFTQKWASDRLLELSEQFRPQPGHSIGDSLPIQDTG